MGKQTKNFRQSNKSNFSSQQASTYAKINRFGSWSKIINVFKKKGGQI